MSKSTSKLHVVDLFAGCGGLSLGLEQAGFMPVFVNELNADARQTYLLNRAEVNPLLADEPFHSADVKEMVRDRRYLTQLNSALKKTFGIEEGELDLVVGGPPCQGFSGIGHRRSYSVDKEQLPSNHLYEDMAHVIHRLQPRAFLFENVRGLLHAKWTADGRNGEIFADVAEKFGSIKGYRVTYRLVYAKDYGVPQNRPRVLIVGMRDDIIVPGEVEDTREKRGLPRDAVANGFLPPRSADAPPSLEDLFGDLEDPEYKPGEQEFTNTYPSAATTPVQILLRTTHDGKRVYEKGERVYDQQYSLHSPRIIEKFRAMQAHPDGEIPEQFRTKKFAQRVLPRTWGDDGPTITATSLPDDYVHYSPRQPRSLTVREWARLQMFPDWYQFAGKRTTGGLRRAGNPREGIHDREVPKYTQIGNAVPVKLAFEVGKHLAGILRPEKLKK
jgi:DNA (cytosine-5)-methyltransferase 1